MVSIFCSLMRVTCPISLLANCLPFQCLQGFLSMQSNQHHFEGAFSMTPIFFVVMYFFLHSFHLSLTWAWFCISLCGNLFTTFANSSKLLLKGLQQTTSGILTPNTTLVGSFLEFFYMWGTRHNTNRYMRRLMIIYLLHQLLNMREKQSCFHAVLQHFSRILGSCSNDKRSEDRQQKTLICVLLSGSHQGNLSPRMSRRKHSTRVSILM